MGVLTRPDGGLLKQASTPASPYLYIVTDNGRQVHTVPAAIPHASGAIRAQLIKEGYSNTIIVVMTKVDK